MGVRPLGPAAQGGTGRRRLQFHDPTWFQPETPEALAEQDATLCLSRTRRPAAPLEVTASFVYIRLHGPDGPYQGSYGDTALRTWARRIGAWSQAGLDAFCYFANDDRGSAPKNALRLKELLA